MKIDELKLKWCYTCLTWYVECPVCQNNTCNGGTGEVNGRPCTICDLVYNLKASFCSKTYEALDNLFDPIEKEEA